MIQGLASDKVYCTHNNRQHIFKIFRAYTLCLKILVLRTPCFGASYHHQGVRVPPVKNHRSRAMLSDKQIEHSFNLHKLSKSGLTQNLMLLTFGSTQKFLWPCQGVFCYQHAFKVHTFRYDLYSIIANFATGFSWITRICTEPNFKYCILQPHLSAKNLGKVALVHQGFFYQELLLTGITEPLGNIIYVVQ